MCLPVKPLRVLVLSLALTNLFVHSSIFVLTFRKQQPNILFYKFLILTVITIIVEFRILVSTFLHILRIRAWKFLREILSLLLFLLYSFSGSVDTIVFFKTGNHLPQCLWFSNSFFTVDGCIDCVKAILNS